MSKFTSIFGAAVLCVSAVAFACDESSDKTAKLASAKSYKCCPKAKDARVAAVMGQLPKMVYKVGAETTHCEKSATKMAGDKAVHFVVADKAYESKTEAVVALAEILEKEADMMGKVRFAVGDKTYCCPMTAKSVCKKGQKVAYRVAGIAFPTEEKAKEAREYILAKLSGSSAKNCDKSKCDKAKTASGKQCSKSQGKVASADAPKCNKSEGKVASADAPKCNKSKAKVASDSEAPKCSKSEARVASADASGCCKKAAGRLAAVQQKIETMVSAAAQVSLSSTES